MNELVADERTRLTAASTRCGDLAQLMQQRLLDLQQCSKTCVHSAEVAVQEMTRWMDQLRAALDTRQQQLADQIRQMQQVCLDYVVQWDEVRGDYSCICAWLIMAAPSYISAPKSSDRGSDYTRCGHLLHPLGHTGAVSIGCVH